MDRLNASQDPPIEGGPMNRLSKAAFRAVVTVVPTDRFLACLSRAYDNPYPGERIAVEMWERGDVDASWLPHGMDPVADTVRAQAENDL